MDQPPEDGGVVPGLGPTVTNLFSPYQLFGVECGAGWRSFVDPLIELCNKDGIEIHQIKEKFGELRFYIGYAPGDHPIWGMIDEAEMRSRETCELCGNRGEQRVTKTGWVYVSCEDHVWE